MDIPSELSKAEQLIAAGQLEEAKAVLRGILAQDKRNAGAWYLVAQSVADPRAKAEALRRTLLTDPDHPRAKREFEAMDGLAILQPPSMTKATSATPAMPPRKTSADVAPKRRLPLVPLFIGGGVVLVVLIGLALVASRPSNSLTPTALALVASASPIVPAVAQTTPTALPTATAIPSTPTASPNGLPTAGDALAQTATAIQQNIGATGTGLAQAAGNKTQVAALTQTATQQGALGATVAAQQTAMAASNALPGTLIVLGDNTHHITASNIQFVTVKDGPLSPDGSHLAYTGGMKVGLFLANRDGSGEQPVTGLPDYKNEHTFAWSPDGHWLSVSLDSGVYLVSVQDGVAHALSLNGTLAWSPDHQHLAVLGNVANSTATGQTSLYVVDLAHLDAPPLSITLQKPMNNIYSPGFSVFKLGGWFGDDQHILFAKSVQGGTAAERNITLLVLDLKTQAQRALRVFPQTEFELLYDLTLAPDGQHLAVLGYANTVAFPNQSKVYLLDANGHDLKVLPVTMVETYFAWSPDSQRLAISSTNGFGYDTDIYQWFQFDDLSLHQVLPGVKGLARLLWSPDSRSLVICQFTQRDGLKVTAGKLLLIPMTAGNTPVALFDQYICPSLWVP